MKRARGFILAGLSLQILLSLPFVAMLAVRWNAADRIFSVEQARDKEARPYALVLGAAVYGTRLSDILKDRMDAAIALYRAGRTQSLIVSGAAHEAEAMRDYALEQGIPAGALVTDTAGVNTSASVTRAAALSKTLWVVSQSYHLPRALFLASARGADAMGVSADFRPYLKLDDFRRRELWAVSKALWDVWFYY